MKRYCLYDPSTTWFILGGMGMLYGLSLGLCVFFVRRFVFESLVATGAVDWTVIPLLMVFLIPPFVIIPILSRKERAIGRYLLRCRFTPEGIHCGGLLWKPFLISWENIRTYGLQGAGYAHVSMGLLFFSTEKELFKKERIARISGSRIVLQLREEIVPPLLEFMPADMKSRLEPAIREPKEIYIQRSRNVSNEGV